MNFSEEMIAAVQTRSISNIETRFWTSDVEAVIGIMLVLLILGTINVFSSSFILAESEYETPYFFLKRHLANMIIGISAFLTCVFVDYHRWRNWMILTLGGTIIALILVLIVGQEINGAKRWLNLVVFTFQPAEIAKLIAIMIEASYLAMKVQQKKLADIRDNYPFWIILVMGALTELEPDMGTMCIIVGIPIIMNIVAGLHEKQLIALPAFLVVGTIILFLLQPYRIARLKVAFDPWSDAQNVGYQTVQSLSAIGSGELTGMGLGIGVSKYEYLPEAHTDFAFAIFCQENGFLGAMFVFMLFAALAIYSARVANKAPDSYGQILSLGIMILIIGQAIANLLMVGGMMPVVGVPLPFISYGGTSLIVSMAAMGILVNIGRMGEMKRQKKRSTSKEDVNPF